MTDLDVLNIDTTQKLIDKIIKLRNMLLQGEDYDIKDYKDKWIQEIDNICNEYNSARVEELKWFYYKSDK